MEDADKQYEPGKPWAVTLDVTLRLRERGSQVRQTCRSDAIEAAADRIMERISELRRNPVLKPPCPRKNCGDAGHVPHAVAV